MEFIKAGTNIDFLGKRKIALIISIALIAITVLSLLVKGGPNYGIDFTGGTQVIVKFSKDVSIADLRSSLSSIDLGDMLVQDFGDEEGEYLIRIERGNEDENRLSQIIRAKLSEAFGKESYEVQSIEMVGPQVGGDLKKKAMLAILYAMGGILIYVSIRFEFRYAIGALIALVHDVIIVVGAFSITNSEISLSVIAAILAVIGYSLNDTIIVYDRIRENMNVAKKGDEITIINKSVNEMLSRTILTSITTLLVVVTLFLYGGGVIHNFAFALMIGVIIGTYSSVFVASPVLIYYETLFHKKRA